MGENWSSRRNDKLTDLNRRLISERVKKQVAKAREEEAKKRALAAKKEKEKAGEFEQYTFF